MVIRKIGSIINEQSSIASLNTEAKKHEKIALVIKKTIPEWVDFKKLAFELKPNSVLLLRVSRSQMGLIPHILPSLKLALPKYKIRKVIDENL